MRITIWGLPEKGGGLGQGVGVMQSHRRLSSHYIGQHVERRLHVPMG